MKCEECGSEEIRVIRIIYACSNNHHYVEEGETAPPTPRMSFSPRRTERKTEEALKMPFGKYKGELIQDLKTDYIRWCLETLERLDSSIRNEMEDQLTLREGKGVKR